MAGIFNEQPGAGFNPAPRTPAENAALIKAIKAKSGAFGKNESNFGLGAGLRSAFDLEGPESLGPMIEIPALDGGGGSGPRLNTINSMRLDPETRLRYLAQTMGDEGLTVPVEDMLFGPEGNFLSGLEQNEASNLGIGGGNLTSPSGINFSQVSGGEDNLQTIMAELEAARREVKDSGVLPRFDQGSGTGNLLEGDILEAEAAEIEALLDNDPVFDDPMGDIAKLIEEAKIEGGRGTINEQPGERQDYLDGLEDAKKAAFKAEDDRTGAAAQEQNQKDAEDAFVAGMEDFNVAKGTDTDTDKKKKKGETRAEALARYQKEFYEATGIEASGKPDKSRALMAFGLALMQNKAGKGFNISKMLGSVAEAGDAAMPYIDKAVSDAKAAKISAGKYALQEIKSDENASAAVYASTLANQRAIDLENLKTRNEIIKEQKKAQAEGQEMDIGESAYMDKFKIGGQEVGIRRAVNPNDGRSIFVDPSSTVRMVSGSYNKSLEGIEAINQMGSLIDVLEESKNSPAGTAGKFILDRAGGLLTSMGIGSADSFFTDVDGLIESGEIPKEFKGMSLETSADTIRRALILRFKRFMSQETGNGISNVDVQALNEASGKLGTFENTNVARGALSELKTLFTSSLDSLDEVITNLSDEKQYLTYGNSQGNYIYEETMKQLNSSISAKSSWKNQKQNTEKPTFDVKQ